MIRKKKDNKINEAVYRWDTRKADESIRFADILYRSVGNVTYADVRNVA